MKNQPWEPSLHKSIQILFVQQPTNGCGLRNPELSIVNIMIVMVIFIILTTNIEELLSDKWNLSSEYKWFSYRQYSNIPSKN